MKRDASARDVKKVDEDAKSADLKEARVQLMDRQVCSPCRYMHVCTHGADSHMPPTAASATLPRAHTRGRPCGILILHLTVRRKN
jgi:hypothetical protein